jgi:hypothetical protein
VLIALALLAAAAGLLVAWRRRALALLLLASALLACAAIFAVASPWVDAKAVATAAPAALALALAGAIWLVRVDRLTGAVLATLLTVGVVWSNLLAYGGVSLAPYGHLRELQGIGVEFAGQGPALMTEFNPYGAATSSASWTAKAPRSCAPARCSCAAAAPLRRGRRWTLTSSIPPDCANTRR